MVADGISIRRIFKIAPQLVALGKKVRPIMVKEKGIGIENTKRRLALQFKDAAEFELTQSGKKVIAQLIFKIHI